MNRVFLLLTPKILSINNSLTLNALLKRLPFLFIGLLFWAGFGLGTYKVLEFIRPIIFFGEAISEKLLSITFFSLGIFMVLSNIITALSAFYLSKDIPLLMSRPVRIRHILSLKSIETIISSSWMVLSFIPPFFIAYGISYHASFLFYCILTITFIPFLLITGGLGITLAHIFARLFSIKGLRLFLFASGLLLFIAVYFFIRAYWSVSPETPEQFFFSLLKIRTESPFLPGYWMTKALMPVLHGLTPSVWHVLLILLSGTIMPALSILSGGILFRNNYERVQLSRHYGPRTNVAGFYPGIRFAFLWKDIKVFFRDAGQWSQLFIIGALILIYIYNFRTLPLKTIGNIFPFMKELLVLINMVMAGLVLSAVAARFLYSSVSLEGMAFWIIRAAPVPIGKLLWSKFMYGFIPVTGIMFAVVSITNIAMQIDTSLTILSSATILILCFSISGLGTGMGAIYPKFKHENVAAVSMSPGGMFFMLVAFLVVLATVSIEAYCFYIYRKTLLLKLELTILQKVTFAMAGWMILLINGLTFFIPMKIGRKHLEDDPCL